MAKKGELTRKQRMFCAEYVVDFNGTQAAIRAGYSAKTANEQAARALAKVNIQEEINRLQNEKARAAGITAEYVLNNIKETFENFKTENPGVALKALELLGKNLSLFSDNLNLRKIKSPEDLTDEEAIAIANKIKEAEDASG